MGRLFWKFFLFFFFAQLSTVLIVSIAVGIVRDNRERDQRIVDAGPPARIMVGAAAGVLETNGLHALKRLIQDWTDDAMPPLYAVNELGVDLLGRQLPPKVNVDALEKLNAKMDNGIIQKYHALDGHDYWLFVADPAKRGMRFPPPLSWREGRGVKVFGFKISGLQSQKIGRLFPFVPLLVGILISFIFAALLAWYFAKPIKQLRLAFESAAGGNLNARVGEAMQGRRDELVDLGTAFDVMVSRVGSLIESKTRLMHQVSHELRSPLARLQIAIGLIKQAPQAAESTIDKTQGDKLNLSLNRIEREAVRMDSLVGELLTLSRLESGMLTMQKSVINLNELLAELLADANFEGKSKSVQVHYEAPKNLQNRPIMLLAEYDLLQRAIDNIVRNAIKYSAFGQSVLLKTAMDTLENCVTLSIRDYGVGLNKSEIEQIFQPFYRADNQLGAHMNDGHGLGLSIAKQIIEAHAGEITAHTTEQGLLVTMKLPLIK